MCDACFKNLIYKFDFQNKFDDFQTIITNKCITKKLEIIKREQTGGLAPFAPYEFYKCNSCAEILILSIAQDAWRGFFLTQGKGPEHIKKLKDKDKSKKIGWLIIVVLTLVTIWKLVT